MREDRPNSSLSFVSGWQERAKTQQFRHRLVLTIALVVSLSVCLTLFFWYRSENYERIVSLNKSFVQDSALQESSKVESGLNDTVSLIKKYARQYTILSEQNDELSVEDRLHVLWDNTVFDRVGFISPDGMDISIQGTCDVSDRNYFKRGMEGKWGYEMLDKSRLTGTPVMVFYAPIMQNEQVTGVMAGFYERHRMDDMLKYNFLNFEPRTYLLQRDGTLVGCSSNEVAEENMLKALSAKTFTDDVDYDEISAAIDDTDRTSISFSFVENGSTSVGVIAQFTHSDWMLLSVMPDTIVSSMVSKANTVGNTTMFIMAGIFMLLIGTFVVFMFKQDVRLDTEMTAATDSLRKAARHDRRQTLVIESLNNTYSSVYYVDIQRAEYERVSESEVLSLVLPDKGLFKEGFGRYVTEFVDEPYHEKLLPYRDIDSVAQALHGKESISFEYQRKDKSWRKGFMIPSDRDENGRILSFVFAVQKIDEEKKRDLETQQALQAAYEAAQIASKAKTTFLSNMSHDIRTPMNGIIGMTAIAAANLSNTEKVSDCLKKITVSSKHLLGLINEVLDMSKIESGKVDLNEEKFSLSDVLDELISINQPLIKEKGHSLFVRIDHLTHENVVGDSTRLQQVFTNLLTNAIKYTPDGGKIEIIVSEKDTQKNNIGYYEVQFRDNGIGMSEEFRKTIFDPFSRADDERLATIQGTGLGMPIARNIIRMMNGDITVQSKINEGSTFTVSFALKLQTEEAVDASAFVDLPVLVVDDDLTACESTTLMLNGLGMKSEWVTSGEEAVAKTVAHHEADDDYYALIVDWQMPGMNGIETTRAIREKVGADIPIIVISAYDWTDIEQEAREAGVNAFLSKPLFKSRLIDLFAEFMGKGKAVDDTERDLDIRGRAFTGKRILLAEDNELNREIAVEILGMMGLEIETAENGKLCVERFAASAPGYYDLIFMDIQMPVMNGYQAAEAIRKLDHPRAASIPIIAMTANAFSTDVRAAFAAGMNGHISKPIDIQKVIDVLEENLH